ncbi:MAG TPA: NBR1-Ig-like domain-containing protein [Anaerolineales bacterium]|nr:NBR1-Ig-like domain-containing protein [Anaerolineales bacterium]
MKTIKSLLLISVAVMLAISACSLPTGQISQTDAINTAVAATISANLEETLPPTEVQPTDPPTEEALSTATTLPSQTPAPTETAVPTLTAAPTNTVPPSLTPIPCNAVSFVKDVTYPDNTEIVVGTAFVKTWRLKNVGSCSWNSSYDLVFMDGDAMSGPAAQPLTGGVVAPNQTVDVSVSLTAPNTIGQKTGRWGIRSPEGVIFTLSTGPFWVKIKTVAAAPLESTLVVPLIASESGVAKSDGSLLQFENIGDDSSNVTYQGFLSFDVSTIPSDATILEVKIDFDDYDLLGDPFNDLSCLRIYPDNFGDLDAGDYTPGSVVGALVRWCSTIELNETTIEGDLIDAIQDRVGHERAKFRIHFNTVPTNNDNGTDMVRFGDGIRLIVKYSH